MKLKVHVRELNAAVRAELKNRFNDAGREFKKEFKKNVKTPYPPASVPGEFPHRRTGRYQRGVRFRVQRNGKWLEMYHTELHSIFLEYGTRFMKARPGFRKTIKLMWTRFQSIILRGTGPKGNTGFRF